MKLLRSLTNRVVLSLLTALFTISAMAQDKKVDVDIDLNKGNSSQWYMSPVVWVIGGAVFILLLVALLRGNRSRS